MSEPTNQGDTSARADWSQVYTSLEWVEGWMADHGYTDAEIAYVVAPPGSPAVAPEVAFAPEATDDADDAEATDDTDDAESSQRIPA